MREGISITSYEFFHNVYQLQNKEVLQTLDRFSEKRYLKKGDFIVRAGEMQDAVYFMESGILRGFFTDTDGKEQTDCIRYQCGTVAMGSGKLVPALSQMSIEMLEGGVFLCIPMTALASLCDRYLEVAHLYNRLLIAALDEHLEQKRVLVRYDAARKFQWFMENFPGIIDRVNNKYVASFLDMAPETLSRLRSASCKTGTDDRQLR